MQNIDTLLRAISTLKVLSIAGDIVLPVAVIIALLIVYFYQRKRIEVLENYMDLWKPKELEEQLKAYMELHERMTEGKLDRFERDLESERSKVKFVQNEKKRLEKQYQVSISKKSDLEMKYERLATNAVKLRTIQLQNSILTLLYMSFSKVQLTLLMYADLRLEGRYPDAPKVGNAFPIVSSLEKPLSKYAKMFPALSEFDVLKPEEISIPEELENLTDYTQEFKDKLTAVDQSFRPFLDRFFEELGLIGTQALSR